MHPGSIIYLQKGIAALPGIAVVTAAATADWINNLTPLQGMGSGAFLISVGWLLYAVVVKAFNRANEIQKDIIDGLREENQRLLLEADTERKLRMSLERAGIADRRKRKEP